MKKYLAVAGILFKAQIIYRFNVFLTALGTLWRVIFAWILWGAIFIGRVEVGGFTLQAMLSYYLVSSFLMTMDLSWGAGREVMDRIKGGTFSKYMVIPSNPQAHCLSQSLGTSAYYGIFAIPAALLSALVFRIYPDFTTDPVIILTAVAMSLLGLVFMYCYQYFVGLWAFKFLDVDSMFFFLPSIVSFFRGEYFPISLLPGNFADMLRFFPFTHVSYTPTMLLIGRMERNDGLIGLTVLAVWVLGMAALNEITYNRLRVKYEGVGI